MTKRLLPVLLLFLLFVACKKEKKPAPVYYSVIGNWSLSSYQTNFGAGVNAAVTQYPCMIYNVLTFYSDSTAGEYYSGIDTCFITPAQSKAAGGQAYGVPGLLPLPAKWSQNGNTVYLTYQGQSQTVAGVVSNVNGKLQIAFKNNVTSGANSYYINSVEVRQ